jgi:hypothetical protein
MLDSYAGSGESEWEEGAMKIGERRSRGETRFD